MEVPRTPLKIIVLGLCLFALSACNQTPRILIVGDSWAFLMGYQNSLGKALTKHGYVLYRDQFTMVKPTAFPGTTTEDFVKNRLNLMENTLAALRETPTLDIVHLSLGGNDAINKWMPWFGLRQEEALWDEICDNLRVIIEQILAVRPTIRVAVCGYDYMDATVQGRPANELNQLCVRFEKRVLEMLSTMDRCTFINNFGLMQCTYGYPGHFDDMGEISDQPSIYEPGELPCPGNADSGYEPFAGGDIAYPSPSSSLATWLDTNGYIHLNAGGYDVLGMHCVDVCYADWLDHPLVADESR